MPTLILLDVSLSMARGWRDSSADTSQPPSRSNLLNLATIGINTLLDFFSQNCKLEYVSMLQYSSLWEALVPFTRDYQLVKEKMKTCAISDKIQLYPPPMSYERQMEFKKVKKDISSVLDIIGFMNISDVASPPSVSRHLLLPIPQKLDVGGATVGKENSSTSDTSNPDQVEAEAKTPSFTVLLHGSLRRENKVALAIVGDEWYGMVYSWANSKKKSNLMISLLEPGTQSLPWLGDIDKLVPAADFGVGADKNPYGEDEDKTPFPVQIQEKKSYSQNCVVWIKPDRLQTDIQKILRHARKLPDKMQNFYKELNRLRRAALSFGFMELLEGMSNMLERECALLQHNNAHPNSAEAALQLNHAAQSLRNSLRYPDVSQNIMPLKSNYSGGDG